MSTFPRVIPNYWRYRKKTTTKQNTKKNTKKHKKQKKKKQKKTKAENEIKRTGFQAEFCEKQGQNYRKK